MHSDPMEKTYIVWDLFVRIFHWSLVFCVILNYFIFNDGKTLHQWIGYTSMALITSRIIWGFWGTRHAQFSDFFPTPKRILEHLHQIRSGNHQRHLGHNPLGALMILTLLTLLFALGTTGWMQTLDAYWGDEWLQNMHRYIGNVVISLATLHALAAIVMSRLERVRLIKAMITGEKEHW